MSHIAATCHLRLHVIRSCAQLTLSFCFAVKVAKKKEAKGRATFEAALPESGQDGKQQGYVTAPHVLFPAPIHPSVAADKGDRQDALLSILANLGFCSQEKSNGSLSLSHKAGQHCQCSKTITSAISVPH